MTQTRVYPVLPFERLAPHIDADGDCWEWTGNLDPQGYGKFSVKIDGTGHHLRAHRLVWIALCDQIPGNLPLDHLCRLRRCVNPDHLEPVTSAENIRRGYGATALNARKVRCSRGHDNNWAIRDGQRRCKTCRHGTQDALTKKAGLERARVRRERMASLNEWGRSSLAPGYFISHDGQIRNTDGRLIQARSLKSGRERVAIWWQGRCNQIDLAVLVADAFPMGVKRMREPQECTCDHPASLHYLDGCVGLGTEPGERWCTCGRPTISDLRRA